LAIKPGGSVSEITGIANASAGGVAPWDLTVFGTKVYFAGLDTAGNVGLWETNGTVFEIAHTATGYASTPANFNGMAPTVKAYGGAGPGCGGQAISPDATGGTALARVGRYGGTGGIAKRHDHLREQPFRHRGRGADEPPRYRDARSGTLARDAQPRLNRTT